MLHVNNLLCARNGIPLFNQVGFSLAKSQALQISGPNGIGKTTLLRTLAGLLRPMSGQITMPTRDLCYVGHKSGMHPSLSVLENLLFVQRFVPKPKLDARDLLWQTLKYFALVDKQDVKVAQLSAGQAQALNLARLYLTNAMLWLLDEPLLGLDKFMCAQVCNLCLGHLQRGGIIIFVSHNQLDLEPYIVQEITLRGYT